MSRFNKQDGWTPRELREEQLKDKDIVLLLEPEDADCPTRGWTEIGNKGIAIKKILGSVGLVNCAGWCPDGTHDLKQILLSARRVEEVLSFQDNL